MTLALTSLLPLIGACLLACVAFAATRWTLAPFFQGGAFGQRGLAGGLILLITAEAGFLGWMALAI